MNTAFDLALLVGDGLMAGVCFIFSVAIMPALGRLAPGPAVAAMQAINRVIVNPLFLVVFLGTAGLNLAALVWAVGFASPGLAVSALTYLLGVMAVTVAGNIPRNNALDRLDPQAGEAPGAWARYQRAWTLLNHVRAVAATTSLALAALTVAEAIGEHIKTHEPGARGADPGILTARGDRLSAPAGVGVGRLSTSQLTPTRPTAAVPPCVRGSTPAPI